MLQESFFSQDAKCRRAWVSPTLAAKIKKGYNKIIEGKFVTKYRFKSPGWKEEEHQWEGSKNLLTLICNPKEDFMPISVDNILKILNQCTLISPLISRSLPASYLDNWAIGPLPHRRRRQWHFCLETKIGLISFSHKAGFLECAVRQ